MKITLPSHLTDAQLTAAIKSLARGERQGTALLIAHLAEFDDRRLYRGAGFASLFKYCTAELLMSECEAYNRIEVARVVRNFPAVLDRLADGSLNITSVRLLATHLTADNHEALFAAASAKSRSEVEELVARHAPRPDVPASVRKLPAPQAPPMPPIAPESLPAPSMSSADVPQLTGISAPVAAPAPSRRPLVSPLSPDRYEIRFTASAQTCEKLRLAQDMLRHAVPNGDPAEIIDRALTVLLEDLARKKFAATTHPRPSRGTAPGSRDIAAKVRRAVWLRDRGRCAFIASGGRRCNERAFLEFHHVDPHGIGGEATIGNVELRCSAHNLYEAELFYGEQRVRERVTRSGMSSPGRTHTRPRGP